MVQTPMLDVATYNIRKAIGLDYKRDPRRVLEAVAHINTDLVALQEADYRFKQRRALFDEGEIASITGLRAVDFGDGHPGLGWHGNVLLVSDKFTVKQAKALDLPALEPRGAVMVDLAWDGPPIRLVSAHLGLTAPYRRMQAEMLLEAAQPSPERITIILGDFNGWGKARYSLKPFRDAMKEAICGRSFPSKRPLAALDRIFYSGPIALQSCGIVQTDLTEIASDHLPIRARFAALET